MSQEKKRESTARRRLSPRQIVNRFSKGEYVDESIEAISSAISSCGKSFNSVTIAFPATIIEQVFENIDIAKALYERRKAGAATDDIAIPDYPQLRDLLTDLSLPVLWQSLQPDASVCAYMNIIDEHHLKGKYHLEPGFGTFDDVVFALSPIYRPAVVRTGLSYPRFEIALFEMVKEEA